MAAVPSELSPIPLIIIKNNNKCNYNEQVREDEMVRACNTYGKEEERIQDFDGKIRLEETTSKTYT
jgi:hypothetical protein